jgi:hypothetical protein
MQSTNSDTTEKDKNMQRHGATAVLSHNRAPVTFTGFYRHLSPPPGPLVCTGFRPGRRCFVGVALRSIYSHEDIHRYPLNWTLNENKFTFVFYLYHYSVMYSVTFKQNRTNHKTWFFCQQYARPQCLSTFMSHPLKVPPVISEVNFNLQPAMNILRGSRCRELLFL